MPIDPSIVLNLQPQKPVDYFGAYGNALTLKNLIGQGQMQEMQLAQAQREQQKQMRLADLVRTSGGDMGKFISGMMEIDPLGAHELGMKQRRADAEIAKLGSEGRKLALESADKFKPLYLQAAQFVQANGYTPESVQQAKRFLSGSGVPADMLAAIPDNPGQQYIDSYIASNMSFGDQLARNKEDFERRYPGELGKLIAAQEQWRLSQKQAEESENTIGDSVGGSTPDQVRAPAVILRNVPSPYDSSIARLRFGDENKPFGRTERGLVVENPKVQEYEKARAAAGASKNVFNVNAREQDESAKVIGKGMGEKYVEIVNSEFNSRRRVDRVSRLQNLLKDVDTGKLTPLGTQLAGYAKSLGFDIDPKLGNKEAAIALENEIALELRNPSGGAGMPGAMSDADRKFLQNMAAFTDKTPKGRTLMVETLKRIADRDAQVAKMAREYRKRNGGVFDDGFIAELSEWSATNPLFPSQADIDAELQRRGGRR
jgi:hypothetical protein